jgi:hypothetical protein
LSELVVTNPDTQQQEYISDPVNRHDLERIFNRQIPVAVKGNQEKGRDPDNFPPNKQRFQITSENNERQSGIKEKYIVEKPLETRLPVHIIPAEYHHQEGKYSGYPEIYSRISVEQKT